MNHRPSPRLLAAALAAFAALPALAQTTGFNQTAAGPHDYNLGSNWVGNTINGIWGSDLTLAADQTVTFGSDTTAGTGLNFRYDGALNLTLRSDGTANRTLTLGGNINFDTVSSNRTITFGSTTANQGLNINLGGATRTFSVGGIANSNGTRTLTFNNDVTNGGLILNGGGNINLNGNTNSLSAVRIQNAALRLNGNSGANTSTTLGGALTIDGRPTNVASVVDHFGGIATITLTPNSNRNTSLSASSLVRENNGVVFFRGNNLGGTFGANNVANITFTTGPALVGGGGAAGTTNISILSWGVGATTAAGNANTFVAYDSTNGIRPLDTATEFVNYAADYNGAVTGTDNNTRIATGTATFTGNNTVNSLFMGGVGTATLNGDGGTLTVTSGAVFLQNTNTAISQNLNFGTREAIIGHIQGQNSTISGGIAGSGGITVYQAQANTSKDSAGTGVTFSGAATYTGDFTVNSRAAVSHSDFLAHGSRSGNVIVNGLLSLNGLGTDNRGYTMNGLYGTGRINKVFSGAGLFRIGDNDSDGDFAGTFADGGNTVIQKIGSGTQIFSGANGHNGATQVLGGTLDVTILANGGVVSGVGRTSNIASNLLLNGGTLKYSGVATSTDRLFTVGALGGALNASGTGAVNFTATGANVSSEAAARAGARTTGSNVVTGVTNFADLVVGARVTGTGITAGTTITAIDTVAGTVTLSANATANSSANLSFQTNRVLALTGTNTGDNTISGVLANATSTGTLGLAKSDSGKWVLAANNTYTGATTVSDGELVVSGSIANSAATVSGGTLRLSGAGVAGSVTVNGGSFELGTAGTAGAVTVNGGHFGGSGTVSSLAFTGASTFGPGNSPGTVTIANAGSFTLDADTVSTFQFTDSTFDPGTFDLVTTAGTASGFLDGVLNLEFSGSGYLSGAEVTFIDLTSITGAFSAVNVTGLSGLNVTVNYDYDAGNVYLTFAAVPEPSAFAALAGLATLGLVATRRRRTRA